MGLLLLLLGQTALFLCLRSTVCPGSIDSFFIILSYTIKKWATTSWTDSLSNSHYLKFTRCLEHIAYDKKNCI